MSDTTIIAEVPADPWNFPVRLVRMRREPARVEWRLEALRPSMLDDAAPRTWGECGRFETRKDAVAHMTLLTTGGGRGGLAQERRAQFYVVPPA